MIASGIAREQLQSQAKSLGFSLFGVAQAQAAPGYEPLLEWIRRGYAAEMSYIPKRAPAYQHPDSVLEGCKSIIMLAMPYSAHPLTLPSKRSKADLAKTEDDDSSPSCKIGSYASGHVDYHDLIRTKLNTLADSLEKMYPNSLQRGVVDTAPLLERDFARLAGIGWVGKNTLLLNREQGSYFFLAALLTNIEFSADDPFRADHCGSCTACIDACPTQAFVEPRVLNASRCISYLTIEYRGVIAEELSAKMEDWVFGCDVCQMVCPWNRKRVAEVPTELQPHAMEFRQSLEHWLTLDEIGFRKLYRKTPFWRTKLQGMQRNAMIAAANSNRTDLRACIERFETSDDEVLRATSRWCATRWR